MLTMLFILHHFKQIYRKSDGTYDGTTFYRMKKSNLNLFIYMYDRKLDLHKLVVSIERNEEMLQLLSHWCLSDTGNV